MGNLAQTIAPVQTAYQMVHRAASTKGNASHSRPIGAEKPLALPGAFPQLSVEYERELGIVWYFMQPEPRPCFTRQLLRDIKQFQQAVRRAFEEPKVKPTDIKYLVLGSRRPGVFNLGGDLALFIDLIKRRDRERLTHYAVECIEVLYPNAISMDLPLTTISLVQGNALGGGFEAALSSNALIAEKGTQMGLPEILFNLFPGMGAYSFIARRLDAARAERMIRSGRTFTAEELYEMGLVDGLAEPGQGEATVRDYIRKQRRFANAITALQKVRRQVQPICYEELLDIALLWVDTALKLEERELRIMERLVRAQNRLVATGLERAA